MNAAQARREARQRAGLEQAPVSERMARWLERTWDELEAATADEWARGPWRDREDEWLENLKKYEAQVDRERG